MIQEVAWFGFVFHKSGMRPDPKKVATIQQKVTPKSVAEVKSFLVTKSWHIGFKFVKLNSLWTKGQKESELPSIEKKNESLATCQLF